MEMACCRAFRAFLARALEGPLGVWRGGVSEESDERSASLVEGSRGMISLVSDDGAGVMEPRESGESPWSSEYRVDAMICRIYRRGLGNGRNLWFLLTVDSR